MSRIFAYITHQGGVADDTAAELLGAAKKIDPAASPVAVVTGRRRLRPIMMTALAAIAGMLPLAIGVGHGAQMLQPLAIAVIAGREAYVLQWF